MARSLGIELTPAESLIIVAVGALGTSIPSAPGYVGTYELAVSSAAAAFGVPPEAALAFAVLLHAVTLLPLAIAGAVSLRHDGRREPRQPRRARRSWNAGPPG